MKCWICDEEINGEMLELTNHFYTHGKGELIGRMVWEHYNKEGER